MASELEQYDYDLPRELIAQWPVSQRSDSRLLVIDRDSQRIDHRHFRDLHEVLTAGDCLVLNDTKVIPARLVGRRNATGGRWQGLFMSADEAGTWKILCKTRGKLASGDPITLIDHDGRGALQLTMLTQLDGGAWAVRPESDDPPLDLLARIGRVPLPPYIRGAEMVDSDLENYQTVYADQPGSIAAPTAGLHFTEPSLERVAKAGIDQCRVTLHVGHDTFRPLSCERLDDHPMHSEWGTVSAAVATKLPQCRAAGGRIVAVGTTTTRLLETAASETGKIEPWEGRTDLFIRPPYTFRAIDALLTNFHLPRTTLLVLVRTFGGDQLMRRAYEEAIDEQYRFYSYGDAMLIL